MMMMTRMAWRRRGVTSWTEMEGGKQLVYLADVDEGSVACFVYK